MDKNLTLNQDCHLFGFVKTSNIQNPDFVHGKDVYSIEIEPEEQTDIFSIGLMFDSYMGPHCANREEVVQQLMSQSVLRFESIVKPTTSGTDTATGEFSRGERVRVSCRFELKNGEISNEGDGQFLFPVFQLRFVDAGWQEPEPEPLPETDPAVLAHYEF